MRNNLAIGPLLHLLAHCLLQFSGGLFITNICSMGGGTLRILKQIHERNYTTAVSRKGLQILLFCQQTIFFLPDIRRIKQTRAQLHRATCLSIECCCGQPNYAYRNKLPSKKPFHMYHLWLVLGKC